MVESPRGRAQLFGELEWRTWGDHSVVFHVPSGHTHLLDVVAAEGLRCLEESPARADELASRMAARLGLEADAALQAYARQLVERFKGAGLLELQGDV